MPATDPAPAAGGHLTLDASLGGRKFSAPRARAE